MKKSIAVAKGDGIGPEIMDVVINIFNKVGVQLDYHYIDMGRDTFLKGHKLGMTPEAQATVEELGVLFKGPMETPKGGGNRSINVTGRKMWGTFANCRVFKTLPGVDTIYSKANIPIDLTIMRENLEDTYGGVEHLVTSDLAISRRFISSPGSYQIHKYAFEYAQQQGIDAVVCGHKANIMKITDGLFLETFYEVAKEYPNIKVSDVIVDDLCMKLVTIPNQYKLIVLPNLQGDIVSDLCAGLVGGLGFAPSANVGNNIAIFEAVHGTAPDKIGKNSANPTALLLSGLMMLNFLGFNKEARKIELALLQTLKDKIHTSDLKSSNVAVSTMEYGEEIIKRATTIADNDYTLDNLSKKAITLGKNVKKINNTPTMLIRKKFKDVCKGVDIFIESINSTEEILKQIKALLVDNFQNFNLEVIANRGTNVFPEGSKYTECINSYILRLLSKEEIKESQTLQLGLKIAEHYKLLGLETLREFDGKIGYSIL